MATRQTTVDFIVEQLCQSAQISARKMFGEYGLFCDAKLVALICDDQLYVKPTPPGRAYLGDPQEAPPYQGAKPCFLIPGDQCENADWLAQLIRLTAAALPVKPQARAKPIPKSARQNPSPPTTKPASSKASRKPR